MFTNIGLYSSFSNIILPNFSQYLTLICNPFPLDPTWSVSASMQIRRLLSSRSANGAWKLFLIENSSSELLVRTPHCQIGPQRRSTHSRSSERLLRIDLHLIYRRTAHDRLPVLLRRRFLPGSFSESFSEPLLISENQLKDRSIHPAYKEWQGSDGQYV